MVSSASNRLTQNSAPQIATTNHLRRTRSTSVSLATLSPNSLIAAGEFPERVVSGSEVSRFSQGVRVDGGIAYL